MSDGLRHAPRRPFEPVRTYHPRGAALRPTASAAFDRLWPQLGLTVHADEGPWSADGALDRRRLFGRDAPLVVEIGSGSGDAVVAMAAADPDRDHLAVDVHVPGIARTLQLVERAGVTNVRVAHGDALDLLRRRVPPRSLDAVHAFFPDPWPKARHHKRRLVAPPHVALMASRLVVGGTWWCATDWEPYAEQMLEVVDAEPGLENRHGGFAPRPAARPVTRFERRAHEAGHPVRDVVAVAVGPRDPGARPPADPGGGDDDGHAPRTRS